MPGLNALRWIIGATIVSTALHYTHNFVAIEDYPQSDLASNTAVQVAIVLSWPILTALGLYGYRLYERGRLREAQACLLTYSLLGLVTLGHFLDGTPDIPAVFFATIFTDFLCGLALIGFVAWTARRNLPREAAHARR